MSTAPAKKAEGLAVLRAPFAVNEINQLPKPYSKDSAKGNCRDCGGYHGLPAAHLDYVGHAALTKRLLEADPSWTWEPLALGTNGLPQADQAGGMWIKLTVCGVTRLGYGDAQGKTGPNGVKEVIGDALRNAAMRFGAALDLWHKGDLYDADELRGFGVEDQPANTKQLKKSSSTASTPAAEPAKKSQNARHEEALADLSATINTAVEFTGVAEEKITTFIIGKSQVGSLDELSLDAIGFAKAYLVKQIDAAKAAPLEQAAAQMTEGLEEESI